MEEVDLLRMRFPRLLQSSSQYAEFACGFRIAWRIAHVEEVHHVWQATNELCPPTPFSSPKENGCRRWEMNKIKSRSQKEHSSIVKIISHYSVTHHAIYLAVKVVCQNNIILLRGH